MEAVAENHLGNQMIGRVGQAHTKAKIHLPVRGEVQVDGRKDLVLLQSGGKKIRGRTNRAVVFKSPGDFFFKAVVDFRFGQKTKARGKPSPGDELAKLRIKEQ